MLVGSGGCGLSAVGIPSKMLNWVIYDGCSLRVYIVCIVCIVCRLPSLHSLQTLHLYGVWFACAWGVVFICMVVLVSCKVKNQKNPLFCL
jgi:hypothetical protein